MKTTLPHIVRQRGPEPKDRALALWWAELSAGVRTRFTFDSLFKAACLEARAKDCDAAGQHRAATADRSEAAALISMLRPTERRAPSPFASMRPTHYARRLSR